MLPVVRRGVGRAGLGAGAPSGSGRPTANGKGLAAQPLRGAAGWGRRPASLAVLLHRSVPVLGHSRWSAAGLPRARPSRCGALSPVSRWRAGCPLLPAVVPPEVGCGGGTWGCSRPGAHRASGRALAPAGAVPAGLVLSIPTRPGFGGD